MSSLLQSNISLWMVRGRGSGQQNFSWTYNLHASHILADRPMVAVQFAAHAFWSTLGKFMDWNKARPQIIFLMIFSRCIIVTHPRCLNFSGSPLFKKICLPVTATPYITWFLFLATFFLFLRFVFIFYQALNLDFLSGNINFKSIIKLYFMHRPLWDLLFKMNEEKESWRKKINRSDLMWIK